MLVWKDSTTYERELQYPESNSISIESRIGEAYQGDHCAVYDTGQIRVFGRLVNEPGHEGGKEENEADLDEPEYVHGRIASTRERGLRPHHVVRGEVGAVLDASHDYRGRRSHQGDDDVIHPLLLAAYAVEVETVGRDRRRNIEQQEERQVREEGHHDLVSRERLDAKGPDAEVGGEEVVCKEHPAIADTDNYDAKEYGLAQVREGDLNAPFDQAESALLAVCLIGNEHTKTLYVLLLNEVVFYFFLLIP